MTVKNPGTATPAPSPLVALRGIAWLLLLQTLGELLSRALGLPVPGPVVGMVLLFGALFAPAVRQSVAGAAEFLLTHLSLLFIPVGVGVMTHLALLSQHGLKLIAVIVLSTWAGLATTAWVLYTLRDRAADADAGAHRA